MTSSSPSSKWKLAQTLEYLWWKRYLRNKDTTTYLSWKASYWEQLLFSLEPELETPEGISILDAGCGPAGIFMVLKGNQVTAVDPLLDKYRDFPHFQPEKYPWVQFRTLALEDLQDIETYDLIFCLNAINHVQDIERCYDNLVRALKPGGTLVISTDAHRHYALKKIFQWIPGDMLHPVQLAIHEYDQLLTDRGISIRKEVLYNRELIFDYYITVGRKA